MDTSKILKMVSESYKSISAKTLEVSRDYKKLATLLERAEKSTEKNIEKSAKQLQKETAPKSAPVKSKRGRKKKVV